MKALAVLQQAFAGALRASGDLAGSEIAAAIASDARELSAGQRLGIYRNHHRLSLAAAIATHYPTMRGIVGDEAFDQLAADYVAQFPPTDACLALYGEGFARFLERDPRLGDLPYLGDVARLDWALIQAQIAPDLPAVTAEDLTSWGADLAAARFRLHPAATLIRSSYPLLAIRRLALSSNAAAEAVDLASGDCNLLVLRQGADVVWLPLANDAFLFLSALAGGAALMEAAYEVDTANLPKLLAVYLAGGGFCSL